MTVAPPQHNVLAVAAVVEYHVVVVVLMWLVAVAVLLGCCRVDVSHAAGGNWIVGDPDKKKLILLLPVKQG